MFNTSISIRRGDVIWYDISIKRKGNVQNGRRPGVVLQNNTGNLCSSTVIVAPITTKIKKEYMPTHVILETNLLRLKSMVMLEQITTINKSEIYERVGTLTDEEMNRIEEASLKSLGIKVPTQLTVENTDALINNTEDKTKETKEEEMAKKLTEKQKDILELLKAGKNVGEIKELLHVSSNTITQTRKKWFESKGEKAPSRLSLEDSISVYLDLLKGVQQKIIATKYGISEASVSNYKWRLVHKSNIDVIVEANKRFNALIDTHAPTSEGLNKNTIVEPVVESIEESIEEPIVEPVEEPIEEPVEEPVEAETPETPETVEESQNESIIKEEPVVEEPVKEEPIVVTQPQIAAPTQLDCFSLLKPKNLLLNGQCAEYSIENQIHIAFNNMDNYNRGVFSIESLELFIKELEEIKQLRKQFTF